MFPYGSHYKHERTGLPWCELVYALDLIVRKESWKLCFEELRPQPEHAFKIHSRLSERKCIQSNVSRGCHTKTWDLRWILPTLIAKNTYFLTHCLCWLKDRLPWIINSYTKGSTEAKRMHALPVWKGMGQTIEAWSITLRKGREFK